jgi:two-component sensor histidine kinase
VAAPIEPLLEPLLRADLDADEVAAEVICEAVTNAFRYGSAGAVHINVEAVADHPNTRPCEISLTVRDDGHGLRAGHRSGLGSALFDELCCAWSHTSEEQGTATHARIALSTSGSVPWPIVTLVPKVAR